jgi:hypothetical protein
MSDKQEEANGIKNILNSYNEIQMAQMDTAMLSLAGVVSTYYKQLVKSGVDIESARYLVVALQQSIFNNSTLGNKGDA